MRSLSHRNLARIVRAVLASSLPVAACGGDDSVGNIDAGDAGDAEADVKDAQHDAPCNCFDCPIPSKYANATYQQCPLSDASTDADDAGDADSGSPSCYADCTIPCSDAIGPAASQCLSWTEPMSPTACECLPLSEDDAGNVTVQCTINYICGRRFDGLIEVDVETPNVLGAAFAKCAWLEAASVRSFRNLARELTRHRAPRRLVRAARSAARDEVRHARAMTRLARRYGARVPRVESREVAPRDLEALALENAVEGCVGETYGALVAAWQAEAAGDEQAREALRVIAIDELRHATLAWQIAAWADARLDARARARVDLERQAAVDRLLKAARMEPPAEVVRATGVPTGREAEALVRKLFSV